MAEQPEANEGADSTGDLRNKLIKRLAVAGVLVAVLLGVLAFFDYLSSAPEEPEEEGFTRPVPVPPKKVISQPVTPASDLPEPPVAAVAADTPAAAPVEPTAKVPEAKPEPRPEAKPAPARLEPHPENRPAVPSTVAPPKVPAMPAPAALKPVAPIHESTAAPIPEAPTLAPAAKPSARVVDARPIAAVTPGGVSRLFSGFLLQAGVFTSPQRAEELHARLTLSGVPSTLETRVQVGPFRSRKEAEAAQAKLKELGIDTVLVPPKGKH